MTTTGMVSRKITGVSEAIVHLIIVSVLISGVCSSYASNDGEGSSLGYSLKLYNAINSFRAKHTVQALGWNRTLSVTARDLASRLLTAPDSIQMGEIDGLNYLIVPGTLRPHPAFVAEAWYNESILYDYRNPGYSPSYLNFTQMVWKSSTSVGVGTYTDSDINYTSVVAKFYPPGNTQGKFRQNVIPKYKML